MSACSGSMSCSSWCRPTSPSSARPFCARIVMFVAGHHGCPDRTRCRQSGLSMLHALRADTQTSYLTRSERTHRLRTFSPTPYMLCTATPLTNPNHPLKCHPSHQSTATPPSCTLPSHSPTPSLLGTAAGQSSQDDSSLARAPVHRGRGYVRAHAVHGHFADAARP